MASDHPFDGPPLLGDIVGPPPMPAADPLIGTTLADRYRITSRLGDGGMGSVYLAEHTALGKLVAIKLLKPEFNSDESLVERFFREARATAAIRHENVVDILDFGQTPEYAFFVMEPLSGCELADLLGRGRRLPWARTKAIMIQVVRALAAAHAAGVVHRDMKPGNVFLIRRGETPDFVKILDFGIAKIDDGVQLTQAGMVFGTASYMAPEQRRSLRSLAQQARPAPRHPSQAGVLAPARSPHPDHRRPPRDRDCRRLLRRRRATVHRRHRPRVRASTGSGGPLARVHLPRPRPRGRRNHRHR